VVHPHVPRLRARAGPAGRWPGPHGRPLMFWPGGGPRLGLVAVPVVRARLALLSSPCAGTPPPASCTSLKMPVSDVLRAAGPICQFRHARRQNRPAGQAMPKRGVTHEAANPLLGLQEFQPEYDELQVGIRCPRQQRYRRNKDAGKREGTRAALRNFRRSCTGCREAPGTMTSGNCGVRREFRYRASQWNG